jgi:hypothetical protein
MVFFMAYSLWARFGLSAKKYQKCDGFLHVMFKIQEVAEEEAEALRNQTFKKCSSALD